MKMTTEIFVERARAIHGSKYDYSKVVYENVKKKVQIICPAHGVFEQTPDKHLHGPCGCPVCSGNQRGNTSDFVKKARAVHGDIYDYSQVHYVNNKTLVQIGCPEHGIFEQLPENHLAGKGCSLCANNVRLTTAQFVFKAQAVHGDEYDYSSVDYRGNRVPVNIICPKHGVFEQIPYVHLTGCGCPVCGRISQSEHRDAVAIHEKSVQTFLERFGVSNPMQNEAVRAKHALIVSSEEVNAKRIQTKRKNGSFNTSFEEYRFGVLLQSLFAESDIFRNYRSDKYPYMCDYYIKSRDLYIELNLHWSHGGHWYTDADKNTVDSWRSKSKYYQNCAETFSVRDVEKRQVARDNNLNYVVFWKMDLSDVEMWIAAGCPDGQDWEREYSWLS